MNDWRDDLADDEREALQPKSMARWIQLMLATLTDK